MANIEKKLLKMNFSFISEIRGGLYEIVKVKNVWDPGTRVDIVDDCICFWDNSGHDHRRCLPIKNILLSKEWLK